MPHFEPRGPWLFMFCAVRFVVMHLQLHTSITVSLVRFQGILRSRSTVVAFEVAVIASHTCMESIYDIISQMAYGKSVCGCNRASKCLLSCPRWE